MLAAKYTSRIAERFTDSDGVWIRLAPGWSWEPGAHVIREGTVREAERRVRASGPCDCPECRA